MIILLGKNNLVERYVVSVLRLDIYSDVVYYPDKTTHYTELRKYIDIAKEDEPPVITTQNLEMINVLLNSDLDFSVHIVHENDVVRKLTKGEAIEARRRGIELR